MTRLLVTVVVPVRNEAKCIERTLESLLRQQFDPDAFEVIVVDGESEDGTVEKVRRVAPRFRHLRVFPNPKRLSSAARNIGFENARGEFVVIIDGHCEIEDPHYLTNLIRAFRISEADSLGRPQPLQAPDPTSFQKAVSAARASWLGHNPDSAIYSDRAGFLPAQNVAVAYRREVFFKLGGFDERFDACEDVDFNTRLDRAGMSCFFTPSIRVDYHPRNSLRGLMIQMQRYGQGRARLVRKYPSSLTLPCLVPPFWIVWLAGLSLLSLLQPIFALLLAASLFSYLVVVLGESARLAKGKVNRSTLRLPFVFCAIHLGFGYGFLREMVKLPAGRVTSLRTAKTSPLSDSR
jgi:succinoglycan biosynthesis protein ExoA